MIDTCKAQVLPEPISEELAGGMQVTFQKDRYTERYVKRLNLNERQIHLSYIPSGRGRFPIKISSTFQGL